jgi:hypothetical protein
MAPEQILEGAVDHRADLFSIGVVAYELLAYSEAFAGETIAAITHKVVTTEPEPLALKVPQVPAEITAMVERLLRKAPADRFSDAESVRLAVSRARRRLQTDSSVVAAPTIVRPPKLTPTGGDRPSDQRQSRGPTPSPGPSTPRSTPGHRKTDREALARRRDEQRKAALDRARAALARDDLESAYDACQQALTFDEQHPDALELEDAIHAALAARDTPVDADDGIAPEDVAPNVPAFDVGPGTVANERMNEGARTAPVDRTVVAPAPVKNDGTGGAVKDVGPTVVAPRRTPMPRHSTAPVARRQPWVLELLTRARWSTAGFVTMVRRRVSQVAPRLSLHLTRRQTLVAAGVLGVLVLAAITVFLVTSRPSPPGTLVVNAVPWGTITSIQRVGGQRLSVPPLAATPLSLSLPPGEYDVVVAGPPPQSQEQRMRVRIDSQATSSPPAVRFHIITPEEYFDAYLAASSEVSEPEGSAPVGASLSQ